MMARARQRGYSVGATKPTGRPCRQRTLRCSQGSQGWKLQLVRQGPERWQWSGREQSRPKPLDIRRPIQGRLHEGGDVQPLVAVVAERDRPLTLGRPHPDGGSWLLWHQANQSVTWTWDEQQN